MSADEIITAAEEDGDQVAKINYLLKKTAFKPESGPAQNATVSAAMKNNHHVLAVLLEWGCPLASKDATGRQAIHAATATGAAESVAVLITRDADVTALDHNGKTPIDLAIKGGYLNVVKELIRGGATVPSGTEMPGLAQVQREATLDKMATQLRHYATKTSNAEDIVALDSQVWKAQREHMRLLATQAEMKAGQSLISLEKEIVAQRKSAAESQLSEDALANSLADKKTYLLQESLNRTQIIKDLELAQQTESAMWNEDMALRQELDERKSELLQVSRTRDEALELIQRASEMRAEALAESQAMEAEVAERNRLNEQLVSELQEAENELRGWMSDRERAAALTAQAHRLLGN